MAQPDRRHRNDSPRGGTLISSQCRAARPDANARLVINVELDPAFDKSATTINVSVGPSAAPAQIRNAYEA
jgi:hypothetical protein